MTRTALIITRSCMHIKMTTVSTETMITFVIIASVNIANTGRGKYRENTTTLQHPVLSVMSTVQCESKKSPLEFCGCFSKTVGNFSTKFCVPIMRSYLC